MTKAIKSNPLLWEKIVSHIKNSDIGGKATMWNARKAQLAVKAYKSLGGKYIGNKKTNNSLVIWTKENWGYIDEREGNRYLPEKIRKSLTPKEKRIENRRKKTATRQGKIKAKYSESVLKKFNKLHRKKI